MQVKSLPEIFEEGSVQYGNLLLPLVAEEVREHVSQGLEALPKQPTARVHIELLPPPKSEDADKPQTHTHLRHVCISPESHPSSPMGSGSGGSTTVLGSLGVRPTDLVLVSSFPIASLSDLSCGRLLYSLALVSKPATDEAGEKALIATLFAHEDSPLHHALSAQDRADKDTEADRNSGSAWYLTPICNTATAGRVWEALRRMMDDADGGTTDSYMEDDGPRSSLLLQLILEGPRMRGALGKSWQLEASDGDDVRYSPLRRAVLRYCRDCGLNASQVRAVTEVAEAAPLPASVSSQASLPSPEVAAGLHLIQGPPGTGKTSTISRLLLVLAGGGASVLVCAPTNVACQEIAARLLRELPSTQFAGPGGPGQGLPGATALGVGDIVLQVRSWRTL